MRAVRILAATLLYTLGFVLLIALGPAVDGRFFVYSGGAACLAVPAVALRRGHRIPAAVMLGLVIPALLYVGLLHAHTIAVPAVDARLAMMDLAMIGWPNGAAMHWGAAHVTVLRAFKLVYLALVLPLVAVWCRRGLPAGPVVALALGGVLAVPLYALAPAAGPWVSAVPPAVAATAWGNAFPSFHVAYALIWIWAAWPLGRSWRWATALFAALTAISILIIGEHYAVDLIGSPAAAATCAWLVERRWRRAAVMVALLVGWGGAVRMDTAWLHVPALLWPAALFTFAAPAGLLLSRRPHAAVSAVEGALQ